MTFHATSFGIVAGASAAAPLGVGGVVVGAALGGILFTWMSRRQDAS